MRSIRNHLRWFVGTVLTAAVIALPASGSAAVYPTNLCVSKKLTAAGVACQQVLTAWSKWEKDPSKDPGDTTRDAAIATALQKMSDAWTKAEQGAAAKGTECAETTASATDVQATISTAAANIAAALNSDADTGDKAGMTCRSKLLKAAAKSCLDQLKAESTFVKLPGKDPEGTNRTVARTTAASKFADVWNKAACDATVVPTTVAGTLASTNDSIVHATTFSPAVADTWTKITPPTEVKYNGTGKKTATLKPICSTGTPYAYFVKRGTSDNLLVYYEGGGACWDYTTCNGPYFDPSVTDSDNPANATTGFFNLNNPANPFRDWNIVFVPYCTGDVHWGNATVTHTSGSASVTIEHRGFANAQVVEKWTREHFVNPPLVVVAGSSAGGYGALLNSMYLLEYVYPGSKTRVFDDAGNGVITDTFLQENLSRWGIEASLPRWIPDINKPLGELSIDKVGVAAAKFYPRTKFAQYTTAYDNVQNLFYNIMLHQDEPSLWTSYWLSTCDWHDRMHTQALNGVAGATNNNYRYYIGPGSRHTVWGYNKAYTDTTGNVPTVLDWITAMIEDDDANWQNEECADCSLQAGDPRPNPLQSPFGANGAVTCP